MSEREQLVEYLRLAESCRCLAAGIAHRRTKAELTAMAAEYLEKARSLARPGAAPIGD
jgi:hypothetical protein